MFLWADLVGLLTHPFSSIPWIERNRRVPDGALALGLSVLLPALLAEVAAAAPYRPPGELGSLPPLTAQGLDIYSRWVYQHRYTIPLLAALASLLLWLAAGLAIHAGARALRGSGTLGGFLKLVGFVSLVGLIVLPLSAIEAVARFSPSPAARTSLASLVSVVGVGIFLWQNFLLVLAAAAHYGISTGRATTAVLGPLGCLLGLGIGLLLLGLVAAFLMRQSVSL